MFVVICESDGFRFFGYRFEFVAEEVVSNFRACGFGLLRNVFRWLGSFAPARFTLFAGLSVSMINEHLKFEHRCLGSTRKTLNSVEELSCEMKNKELLFSLPFAVGPFISFVLSLIEADSDTTVIPSYIDLHFPRDTNYKPATFELRAKRIERNHDWEQGKSYVSVPDCRSPSLLHFVHWIGKSCDSICGTYPSNKQQR